MSQIARTYVEPNLLAPSGVKFKYARLAVHKNFDREVSPISSPRYVDTIHQQLSRTNIALPIEGRFRRISYGACILL